MCNTFAKSKKQYFLNFLNNKPDNKKFWKSVKPLYSDKITIKEIINLTENGEILSSEPIQLKCLMTTLAMMFKISISQERTPC